MRRFNAACGSLLLFLLAAVLIFGRQGGAASQLIGATFAAVIVACLIINIVAFLLQTVMTLARHIVRDVGGGVHAAGRRAPRGVSGRASTQAQLPRYDLIEELCRQTGWVFISREADKYRVRSGDHRSDVYLTIWCSERYSNVLFQAWFPVQFPLQQPPAGLSERLLMRNRNLRWASWTLTIGQSCEACLYVAASVPPAALDARLFAGVCGEIAEEIRSFHQELHDKFRFSLGGAVMEQPYLPPQPARPGVPQRRGDNLPDVWYVN